VVPSEHSPHLDELVASIGVQSGQALSLEGRFAVGSGAGAYAVQDADGTPLVLKWWPRSPEEQERFDLRAPRIPMLRNLGWPIPALRQRGIADACLFEIWEVAPGEPCVTTPAPAPVVAKATDLVANARGGALGDGQDWPSWLRTWIRTRLDSIPPAASADVAALVASCRDVIDRIDIPPGRDLIHGDFTPANLLMQANQVTAVVDMDDCRDGDGTLDLIGIVWDLEGWGKASPEQVERLWADIVQQVDAPYGAVLLAYWIAGTLAWAAGTEEEARKTRLAQRAWRRFNQATTTS
jgi:hypothetical protein